ncbi:Butyrophilin subfamily 1 member A1, partial [Mesitornis unicolor]
VTLDPNTAHPQLLISENLRGVTWKSARQDQPKTTERFTFWCCVLGREGFKEGRHCWEVEVDGEVEGDAWWAVGVARASVNRTECVKLSPESGIWGAEHWKYQFVALTYPCTPLSSSLVARRLWVCLDCTQGLVTFLNADSGAEIFTFPQAVFNGESIHPWFML